MLDETRYGLTFPFRPAVVAQLAALLIQAEAGVLLIARPADEVVGFVGAVLGPHLLTGDLCVEEVGWWVAPERRGSTLGPKLLRSLENWARHNGAVMLKMVAPVEPDGACPIGRFYARLGYVPIETAYLTRL